MASGSASRGRGRTREAAGGSSQLARARTAPSLAAGAVVEARAASSAAPWAGPPSPGLRGQRGARTRRPWRLGHHAPGGVCIPRPPPCSGSPRTGLPRLRETRHPLVGRSATAPTAVLSGDPASPCGDALDAQGRSSTQCFLCVEGSVPDTAILSSLQPASRGVSSGFWDEEPEAPGRGRGK